MKKLIAILLTVTLVLGVVGLASAEYPKKNIKMLCPWGAGGGTDAVLRALCLSAEKELGKTIVVENKTGGGGLIGHTSIAQAKPDGYTVGMITFELQTYKPQGTGTITWEDYIPLCLINTDAASLTVNKAWAEANMITDVATFVEYCKAHPGEVTIGNSAPASVWHIGAGLFATETGIDVKYVSFEGGAAAVTALAGGHIEAVSVSLAECRSQLDAGNVICLGYMDSARPALYPDIPTFQEQGYDIVYGTWRGLAVPKKTDAAIVTKLEETFKKATEDPAFVEFMNNGMYTIAYKNSAEFSEFLAKNAADVDATMAALGLKK